jgi:uncharacterized protein YbaA (DUF1428 family)
MQGRKHSEPATPAGDRAIEGEEVICNLQRVTYQNMNTLVSVMELSLFTPPPSSMHYVDGYVLAVPKKNLKAYKKMASAAGKAWMKHGALSYTEALGEDLVSVKQWGGYPFPDAVKAKKDEVVIFSYVVYKSRKHRDQVNAKVHKDPFMNAHCEDKPMPFDLKRMAYGGFETIVDL